MITIVGAGALGSHVALFLRNSAHQMEIIDFDRVEKKNLQAQFHTALGVGRNKAQALSQSLAGMFLVKTYPNPHKLTDDNAKTLLEGMDLIIDCTDNIAARIAIYTWSRILDTPCLHGCLSANGDFARVIWSEDFAPDAEGEEGEATCEDGEALPFIGFAASFIALEAQRFLETRNKMSYQLTPAGTTRLT
jgi:adenylyltransferase/sulfurtransferase